MRLIPQPESIEIFSCDSYVKEITSFEITDKVSDSEGYELIIEENKITARASTQQGLFYAKTTFSQLMKLYGRIPCMKITDKPRYRHRGFMIDCARHMFTLEELKRMISLAADVKFNKFHWHLSDDQGFRIELESFPEITEKGSVRSCDAFTNCKSDNEYSGYYKKEEIREIIEFCKERFIDVIPEFDMPGHQSALLHVMPQFTCSGEEVEVKTSQGIFKDIICAGNLDAHQAIEKILDEICELFPYTCVHIGGDEVPKSNWQSCGKCRRIMLENGLSTEDDLQCWFINKMAEYLKNKGKRCIVWNDCLKGNGLSDELTVQFWQWTPRKTAAAANRGQKLIFSPFSAYYVDYPYGMHPLAAAYKFEPENFKGLNATGRKNILGVETPIWTEHINNEARLQYMCFPRFFAVAETGWTAKENRSYREFLEICKIYCGILRHEGINIADENEWDPPALKRLVKTVGFFLPK